MEIEQNVETEDFLEHFGVKGMHWGQRHAGGASESGGSSSPSPRAQNRALNKASRATDKAAAKAENAKNIAEIHAARARVYGGENKAKLGDAKAQYKADKVSVGSREARKTLNKTRNDNFEDLMKAQEYAGTKEFVKDLLGTMVLGKYAPVAREISVRRSVKKHASATA